MELPLKEKNALDNSQSEYRKAVVYVTVLHLTFPSCTVLIASANVLCITWYKIASVSVHTEKMRVTSEKFHVIPLEGVAYLLFIMFC